MQGKSKGNSNPHKPGAQATGRRDVLIRRLRSGQVLQFELQSAVYSFLIIFGTLGCSHNPSGIRHHTTAATPVPHALSSSPPVRDGLEVRGRKSPAENPIKQVDHKPDFGFSRSPNAASNINDLIALALQNNPRLQQLEHEMYAARAKIPQVEALPDPMVSANGFGHPIETAAGSQRANMMISQRFPWFEKLNAHGQQAAYEAHAMEQVWRAEQLSVIAEVQIVIARLYTLEQELRINSATKAELERIRERETAQVEVGTGSAGDVLLSSLEISRLREQRLKLKQGMESARARLIQLLNVPADFPITVPTEIRTATHEYALEALRSDAYENQPAIIAARLRSQAAIWGMELAALARVPDVTVSLNWFFIDDNRPASRIVNVGEDAWSIGAAINIPLGRAKYNAMWDEAGHRQQAAVANVEDVMRRYDALLADLVAQAGAARETIDLYESTILPQARQVLEADQQALPVGKVTFERVIASVRNLLMMEANYHQAQAELATVHARIDQAAGMPLGGH